MEPLNKPKVEWRLDVLLPLAATGFDRGFGCVERLFYGPKGQESIAQGLYLFSAGHAMP